MKLSPMSESEFEFWESRSRKHYAQDKMRANNYSLAEAEQISAEDFKRFLPDGLKSKDSFLFTAKNDDGTTVGFAWFTILGAAENRRAWVCDIIIEEPLRGMGYGRQTMRLLEVEVKKQGLTRMGLHVFGFNTAAIGLYQSLGYLTTDISMEKSLA